MDEALSHPYFSSLHCKEDEPVTRPVSKFDFLFENQILTVKELKNLVYDEILLYHFPEKVESYTEAKLTFEKEQKSMKQSILSQRGCSSLSGGGETSSDSDFLF